MCQLSLCLHDNILGERFLLRTWQFLGNHLLDLGNSCFNRLFLLHCSLKPAVIDSLLLSCELGIFLLQLQRLYHVWAAVEPQYKIIACLYTFICDPCLTVQFGQLIGPLLCILPFFIFFKNSDLVLYGRPSAFIYLIF